MEAKYQIVYKGRIKEEFYFNNVVQDFSSLFKVPTEKATIILQRNDIIFKQGLSLKHAKIFQEKLRSIGILTEIIEQVDFMQEPAIHKKDNRLGSADNAAGIALSHKNNDKKLNANQSKIDACQSIVLRYFHNFEFSVKNRLVISLTLALIVYAICLILSFTSLAKDKIFFVLLFVSFYWFSGMGKIEDVKLRNFFILILICLANFRLYEEELFVKSSIYWFRDLVSLLFPVSATSFIFRFCAYLRSNFFS